MGRAWEGGGNGGGGGKCGGGKVCGVDTYQTCDTVSCCVGICVAFSAQGVVSYLGTCVDGDQIMVAAGHS